MSNLWSWILRQHQRWLWKALVRSSFRYNCELSDVYFRDYSSFLFGAPSCLLASTWLQIPTWWHALSPALESVRRRTNSAPDCLGLHPLPFTSCVILSKTLNLSVPWVPHLQNGIIQYLVFRDVACIKWVNL